MTTLLPSGRVGLVFDDASTPESSLYANVLVPTNSTANLLVLSYTPDASVYREGWQRATERAPGRTAVVTVRDDAPGPEEYDDFFDPVVRHRHPTDLAGIGVDLGRYLSKWHAEDARTVLWVDSLTALLDHVDTHAAFQFLHVLVGNLVRRNTVGWVLVDPTAHDTQTLSIFKHLCDATVEFVDGEWHVTER